MKIDFDVLRWRFLFIGFIFLFFVIGAGRFLYHKAIYFLKPPDYFELRGKFPVDSLGSQIQDAQRRSKKLEMEILDQCGVPLKKQ